MNVSGGGSVIYRNEKTINDGIKNYKLAMSGLVKLGKLLHYNIVKDGASRIISPRLHIDLGVTSQMLKIHI